MLVKTMKRKPVADKAALDGSIQCAGSFPRDAIAVGRDLGKTTRSLRLLASPPPEPILLEIERAPAGLTPDCPLYLTRI